MAAFGNYFRDEAARGITRDIQKANNIITYLDQAYVTFCELHRVTCDKQCLNLIPSVDLINFKKTRLFQITNDFERKKEQTHSHPTWWYLWSQINELIQDLSQINGILMGVIRVHNLLMLNVSNFFECSFYALAFEQII